MLTLLLSAAVIAISMTAIIATIKAELPHIARALGGDGFALPPLQSTRTPRIRVRHPLRAAERPSLRVAA